MKLIVSCEDTGALKVVTAQHGVDTSRPAPKDDPNAVAPPTITTHATGYSRKSRVVHMVKSPKTGNIAVTRSDGSVQVYDTAKLRNNEVCNDDSELLPLLSEHKNVIPESTNKDNEVFVDLAVDDIGRLLTATNKGTLFIWSSEEKLSDNPANYQLPLKPNEVETDLRIVKLPTSSGHSETPEIVFAAKNVSNSKLELRVPIHIKKILFDKSSTPENFKLYTFTQWGDLRFYDSSQGRKPRYSKLILPSKGPVTNAIWMNDDFVVTNTSGIVEKVNSTSGSQVCQFKDHIGSIQSLFNFNDSILVTAGTDRYVRAYNNKTRDCIVKVFVGTQSNAVILLEDSETLGRHKANIIGDRALESIRKQEEYMARKASAAAEDSGEESDEDELWSKLDSSSVTQRRKRRKITLA
ncbi:hypothetical protein CAS74_002118 [Pichia kudriavzevii]|uniref:Ribosome biogenesis protein NSA1 n=1 Tax=Pichia kudriavzevii TaxID=4909 RepID=A0A1Z8JPB4_PICKU|nr:hypothetical protein CAS74_002118 [Pichia kudriavzevii]